MKILLVEDHPLSQLVIKTQLIRFGCNVVTASTGAEAVQLADESFDFILMDIGLPDYGIEGGIRATKEIRAKGGYLAIIPIVALTANEDDKLPRKMIEAGANDYLNKPADDKLLEKIIMDYTHRYPHAG